ncbi:MAG: DNA recombination protein RmuC, partial [Ignavibacteria bacterium]|nr:DNA recombination protein RmuC [Ignavibacteria bacterium]
MDSLIIFLIGFAIGALIVSILFLLRRKDAQKIAETIIQNNEAEREKELQQVIENLRGSFSTLSLEALERNTKQFLHLATETLSKQVSTGDQTLTQKKALIDQTLQAMKDELNNVQKVIKDLEGDRVEKFGALANWLKESNKSVKELMETTGQLKNVLSSSKVRGQWGERMAEDILRLSGLKEGINYLKQKALQSSNTRPDFTFLLPNKLVVNMDVKFPFDNYLAYNNTDNEAEKEKYKNNFLKDIRTRIKEVTTRDYINPSEN